MKIKYVALILLSLIVVSLVVGGCGDDNGGESSIDTDIVWITIPEGTYQMGWVGYYEHETPVHEVNLPSFEILKTEVTVTQYGNCVMAEQCTEPNPSNDESECNWNSSGNESHPVNCVDWDQSVAYCEWAGGRLPSEAEWEYSARSLGQEILYPWGDETPTCDYAIMYDEDLDEKMPGCGAGSAGAVCSKIAGNTDQELCDMSGNVLEWVQDWYHGSYDCDANPSEDNCDAGGTAPSDGSAWETPIGSHRVYRGGSWSDGDPIWLRTSSRARISPTHWSNNLGFRCARDLDQ